MSGAGEGVAGGAGLGRVAETTDIAAEMRQAVGALTGSSRSSRQEQASTSDLSIDEALLLHSVGWEALELVCGVSMVSIPMGVWNWGSGEITWAVQGETTAMANAAARLAEECAKVSGHGVVGVEVEVSLHSHHVEISLVGTAVRPITGGRRSGPPFVSDLSGKDFALLDQAGWEPLGIAFGTSFVYAPRRSAGTALRQSTQNVELTNYTEALYAARESGHRLGRDGRRGRAGPGGAGALCRSRHRLHRLGHGRQGRSGRAPPYPAPGRALHGRYGHRLPGRVAPRLSRRAGISPGETPAP